VTSSTRTRDARSIFLLIFFSFSFPLCSPAWADSPNVVLSKSPAARALAVSGNQSPSLFVPPTLQVDEGSAISIQVTATDPDPTDNLKLTLSSPIALGLTLNASVAPSLLIAKLNGAMGYTDAGTYDLAWSLSDGMNPPVTAKTTLTVRSVTPPPNAPPISVFPSRLLLDVRANVVIKGPNFGTSTWVELRGTKGTISADTVTIVNSTALVASVLVPASMEGSYDLVMTGPAGQEQKLPSGITASVYRFQAIDATTGARLDPIPRGQTSGSTRLAPEFPMIQSVPRGQAPRAPKAPMTFPDFPCEGVNFCSLQTFVGIKSGCEGVGVNPYFSYNYLLYQIVDQLTGQPIRCWTKLKVRNLHDPIGLSNLDSGGHCHPDENMGGRPL